MHTIVLFCYLHIHVCAVDSPLQPTEFSNTCSSLVFHAKSITHTRVKAHITSLRSPQLHMHARSGVAMNIGITFLKAISGFS